MTTLDDYVGRTVDLSVYDGVVENPRGQQLTPVLIPPGTGGFAVTGIEKLVQRFIQILLLERGSIRYRPDDGCDFMVAARFGAWRSAADVSLSFYEAQIDVRRQLQAVEDDQMPDDERFASETLNSVTFIGGQVSLSITLESLAGSGRKVIVPVSLIPITRVSQ